MRVIPKRLRYAGWQQQCPCCLARLRVFQTFRGRPGAQCPRCGALERHRVLARYIADELEQGSVVLHLAPEPFVVRALRRKDIDYTAADLHPEASNIAGEVEVARADIMDLPFEDDTFDFVLVSHVLEHVDDDRIAVEEVHRVLRPGGRLVSQHPWDPARAKTHSDPGVSDPAERKRLFGQIDHVRSYGRDHLDLYRRAGFDVRVLGADEHPSAQIAECRKRASVLPGHSAD